MYRFPPSPRNISYRPSSRELMRMISIACIIRRSSKVPAVYAHPDIERVRIQEVDPIRIAGRWAVRGGS